MISSLIKLCSVMHDIFLRGFFAGYFAGQKSLDDTVRLIQNRVSLYVAEQK